MTNKQNIVLFDLDGTLTNAREKITTNMIQALCDLRKHAEVGIVSGSSFDYIKEQIPSLVFSQCKANSDAIGGCHTIIEHILPCNGTQYWKFNEIKLEHELIHSVSMREELGMRRYQSIVKKLVSLQNNIMEEYYNYELYFSGEFISYRGSMINWSPIGRAATQEDRDKFIKLDKFEQIRETYLKQLSYFLSEYREHQTGNRLHTTAVLGGQTSFDIYPTGWDKRYALRHFDGTLEETWEDLINNVQVDNQYNIWFVGDKCTKAGNDRTIYEEVLPNAFEVNSPQETIKLINNKLMSTLNDKHL